MSYETDVKIIQLLDELPPHKWVFLGMGGYATVLGDYKFLVSSTLMGHPMVRHLGVYVYLKDFDDLNMPIYTLELREDVAGTDPLWEPSKDLWDKLVNDKDKYRLNYKGTFEKWVMNKIDGQADSGYDGIFKI